MEHFYQNIQGWFNYQKLFTDVIRDLPNNAHIVEIGAWKGASTSYLAVEVINFGKNIKTDVVDTWQSSTDDDPSNGKITNGGFAKSQFILLLKEEVFLVKRDNFLRICL